MKRQDVAHGGSVTQNDLLLDALVRGVVLTPYSALQIAGTLRLSERIRELVKDGVPIDKEWVKTETARVMGYRMGRIAHG